MGYEATDRVITQDTGLADLRRSPMIAETPVLWLGDFLNSKRTHSLIIQATGKGRFYIDALDDEERMMASLEVNLDADGDLGGCLKSTILSHLIISFGSGFGSAGRTLIPM